MCGIDGNHEYCTPQSNTAKAPQYDLTQTASQYFTPSNYKTPQDTYR